MVRRVVTVEKRDGEQWVTRMGRGRVGWRGERRGVAGGGGISKTGGATSEDRGSVTAGWMDAATLGRMLSGLGEPFGDGWKKDDDAIRFGALVDLRPVVSSL